MKSDKRISICIVMSVIMLCLTGCGSELIAYMRREKPDKAMERHLEEKYGDEFTCIEWNGEDTFTFFWDKASYSGKFESEKYPGKVVKVGGAVLKDGSGYKFWDNYQHVKYLKPYQTLMEQIAQQYFKDEYYVYGYKTGPLEEDVTEAMSFEEYLSDDYHFGVCIFAEEMELEEAMQAMHLFMEDIREQGILCEFFLGKINQRDISKEDFLEEMRDESEVFNPWLKFGDFYYTNWLYAELDGEDVTWKYQRD